MREILFRAFCECDNGNQTIHIDGKSVYGKWLYGYPVIDNAPCVAKAEGKCKCPHDGSDSEMLVWDDDFHEYDAVPVISSTIGQYTGLVDQNGKTIFEGDIVRHGGKNFIVKWINQYARFAGWEEGAIFCSFLLDKSVVIGNIYENPELLEGDTE